MSQTVLIPGGAGYIGSHTAYQLSQLGYRVIILDDLSHKQKFNHKWATLIQHDFSSEGLLHHIFKEYKIDAVMHFAALIEVGESVKHPRRFYENNVVKTLQLLDAMLTHGVKKFIFSSSCAVYGEPVKVPMNEQNPYNPISPYGKNKLTIEYALQDYSRAYGLKYVSLRYFNAAGAMPEIGLGEQHDPETHIIPLMLRAIQNGKTFKIFGNDYNTPDGTCIRDYIHVRDIAKAHVLGLKHLNETNNSDVFNLGSEAGYSVKQMINAAERIAGLSLNTEIVGRREGDPAILLADSTKIKKILGWKTEYSDLDTILMSAWEWEQKQNNAMLLAAQKNKVFQTRI
jgi:UDP-glucose 4-epimerase